MMITNTHETAVWRRYDSACFDGGTIGGRGYCSVKGCAQAAIWMREQRDKRHRRAMYAYCQEHRDTFGGQPSHSGQRGCGCHVAILGPGRGEVVYCSVHDAMPELLALVIKAHRDLCGCTTMDDDCGWPDARAAIRKATEGEQ